MKTFTRTKFAVFIAAGCLVLGEEVAAQIDTSILKNGNTWWYTRSERSNSNSGQIGLDGTSRFTLDSLLVRNDSLFFKVVRIDSGKYNPDVVNVDTSTIRTTTSRGNFSHGVFSQTPFFMVGQVFSDSSSKLFYNGDSVKVRFQQRSGCTYHTEQNIETLGLFKYLDGYGGCGSTNGYTSYQLTHFNGQALPVSSLTVGIHPGQPRSRTLREPRMSLQKQTIFILGDVPRNLKGQTLPIRAR